MSNARCVHTRGATDVLRDDLRSLIVLQHQKRSQRTFHYQGPTALYRATATHLRVLATLYQAAQEMTRVASGQPTCYRVAPLTAIPLTLHLSTPIVQVLLLEVARVHGLMTMDGPAWRTGGHAITVNRPITQLWHLRDVQTAVTINAVTVPSMLDREEMRYKESARNRKKKGGPSVHVFVILL